MIDHDMQVSHIIRGDDHLTNAARQILLYQAFGWAIPSMTHIPLIHGDDGAKLSKRHGALGVKAYKDMGYLPEALCNYLLRLGWAHKDDEIISWNQAIEWFTLDGLGKASSRLDFAKMNHLNSHYLRQTNDQSLTNMVYSILQQNYKVTQEEQNYINQAMEHLKIRSSTLVELAELAKIYLVNSPIKYSPEAIEVINNYNRNLINQVIDKLQNLSEFNKDTIQIEFKELAKSNNIKLGDRSNATNQSSNDRLIIIT